MINKKAFIFSTLTEAYKYKIGADPENRTYRLGSFGPDAGIFIGEPDISYYAQVYIREVNQMWLCNQFWLNDVQRSSDNDLTTEKAERRAADEALQQSIDELTATDETLAEQIKEREEADDELEQTLANQQAALTALGLAVDGLAGKLITMEEYRATSPKAFQVYYVARDETDKAKLKCWRIYLRSQLIGEFESSGTLTLPVFPMRFPFRFA